MKTYLITADDYNGDSVDWFVNAETPAEAKEMYVASQIEQHGLDDAEVMEIANPADDPNTWITHIFEVPQPTAKGVIDWSTVPDLLGPKA